MNIDVSKCEYLYKDICNLYEDKCKYISDCYYKQRQQLKAENDEFKKLKYEILNKKPSEREYCKNCILPAYSKVLDEIEKILLQTASDSQLSCILAKSNILQLIKQAKEGGE